MTGSKIPPLAAALQLRDALQRAGVPFVHWKSNDHLAEALAGKTDIDIYVEPAYRAQFDAAMTRFGALRMQSQPWASYPDVEDWLVFDRESGQSLHVHQHFVLITGLKRVKHLRLPWGETLMANLRTDPASGWPIPAAEMELLILLVRIWAKTPPQGRWFAPKIPSHILREIEWLRAHASEPEFRHLAGVLFPGLDPAVFTPLLSANPPPPVELIRIARMLNDRLRENERMPWRRALLLAVKQNLRMVLAKARRVIWPDVVTGKTLPSGGLMIALIGSDGAGKSTVSREIRKWLRFKLDVHSYYMGSGDGGTRPTDLVRRCIRVLVKSLQRSMDGKPKTEKTSSASKPRGFPGKLIELYQLVIMRHKVKLLRAARRLTHGGSVALLDRYPQTRFTGISDGPKMQGGRSFDWAARRELELYAQAAELGPDMVIKLRITPEAAQARKPDHDLETIRRKCGIVDALDFPDATVIEVDAGQPHADVVLSTKREIWKQLLARQG